MHIAKTNEGMTNAEAHGVMLSQLEAIVAGERNGLANAANMAALIYQLLPDLNWAGFYFLEGHDLVLGPFQGKVACVRIEMGRGVCGAAGARRETIVVPDVNAFPGHIACDAASRSEIVVPLIQNGRLIGVLDLDSPKLARFGEEDAVSLSAAVSILLGASDFAWIQGA